MSAFIEEQLRQAINESAARRVDWCVTLEAKVDPEKWIQLTADQVNLHYPVSDAPADALIAIDWPADLMELVAWEADLYVTFTHRADASLPQVAEFVQRYVEKFFGETCQPDAWTVSGQEI